MTYTVLFGTKRDNQVAHRVSATDGENQGSINITEDINAMRNKSPKGQISACVVVLTLQLNREIATRIHRCKKNPAGDGLKAG